MSTDTETTASETTEPLGFYLLAECRNCDAEMYYGPCVSLLEHHRGLPVVTFDLAAQTRFDCERCGAQNYTGDFDMEYEGGEDPDELDDDETVDAD